VKQSLVHTTQKFINNYALLEQGDKILVAVSGGPDSVALLHLLLALQKKYDLTLILAHLEHGIRGEESKNQASFVHQLGERLGLNCIIHYTDVPQLQKISKGSLEETARVARYRFLQETAYTIQANKIALGHTANDQAETLLMRLLRGAGIDGLSAMRPTRGKNPALIRPLLNSFRREILAFLDDQNIAFCLDSTNLELSCLRNKIRLQLIPLLGKEYNPQILSTLHRTASILGEEKEWMAFEVKKNLQKCLFQINKNCLCLNLHTFSFFPLALQREVLRQAIQHVRPSQYKIDFTKVSQVLQWLKQNQPVGMMSLSPALHLRKQPGKLWIGEKKPDVQPRTKTFSYQINIPGETQVPELNLRILTEIIEPSDLSKNVDPEKAYLDFDRLCLPLYIRTRKTGDRFQPFGLQGTKKLKKFFIDAKIPREKRGEIPIISSEKEIVWVLGMRIADQFKVTQKTKKILLIKKVD